MKKLLYGMGMVIVSWASVISGCSDAAGTNCTLIGCANGVTFKLGKPAEAFASGLPLSIEVCVDAAPCNKVTVDAKAGAQPTCTAVDSTSGTFVSCNVGADGSIEVTMMPDALKDAEGSHEAHVTIRDAADAVVLDKKAPVSITESFPNGEDCGPACYDGTASITP